MKSHENKELDLHKWYVMAPIYFQESNIKKYLDERNIRCYLPTKAEIKIRNGKKQLVQVPTVNSLLFIYTTESELKEICKKQPYLHYKYDKTDGVSNKMTVPTKQMEDFICLSNLEDREVFCFDPQTVSVNLERGVPIRIHCGNSLYDGVEGIYTKIEGKRDKQLVISLNGLYALSMKLSEIDVIEKL